MNILNRNNYEGHSILVFTILCAVILTLVFHNIVSTL